MLRCSVEMRQRYSHKKCNLYDYVNFAYAPRRGPFTYDLKTECSKAHDTALNTKTSTEGDDQIAPRHVLHDRSRTD
jgi:hypothetical protein